MNTEMEDRYLGDGVYASFDGYCIYLDLRAQDGTTRIALEPPVIDALVDYCKAIEAKAETQAERVAPEDVSPELQDR